MYKHKYLRLIPSNSAKTKYLKFRLLQFITMIESNAPE
jgi:hypothetical protein